MKPFRLAALSIAAVLLAGCAAQPSPEACPANAGGLLLAAIARATGQTAAAYCSIPVQARQAAWAALQQSIQELRPFPFIDLCDSSNPETAR